MSDIIDISDENMKILTGLPAKSDRVKNYSCITVASYIYVWNTCEITFLLFNIYNTHMPHA